MRGCEGIEICGAGFPACHGYYPPFGRLESLPHTNQLFSLPMSVMRQLRRNDLSPRVEMLPLIDVIFLLITFFIYSLIMMVQAEVLPVELTALATGSRPAGEKIQAVTIDKDGQYFFNREKMEVGELNRRLTDFAEDPDHPTLYVGVEAQGRVDRGPLIIDLIERIQAAGISDVAIVGQPGDTG